MVEKMEKPFGLTVSKSSSDLLLCSAFLLLIYMSQSATNIISTFVHVCSAVNCYKLNGWAITISTHIKSPQLLGLEKNLIHNFTRPTLTHGMPS